MHVALVTQNSDLELDLRPRAEAEALADAGFEVTLVGGTQHPERLREITKSSVAIASYPLPREGEGAAGQIRELTAAFTRMQRALVRLARTTQVDVVHASNPPDNVWLALPLLRAAQRRRPRFVFDQHDVAPVLVEEKFGSAPHMKGIAALARRLERRSFARADLVVFANAEYERRAESRALLRGDSVVVPNGWSLPQVPTSDHWRGEAKHLIAYVGAINEQDCVDHLVEAVARLPQRDGVRVCVAGDGAGRSPAQRLAHELGVTRSFDWLGWVRDRDQVASLVRSADLCVAPEVDSPFNRLASFVKLVEYMSVGAPTVAHRLAQNERLCGETVMYAEDMSHDALAEAMSRMLTDPTRGAELGRRAKSRFDSEIAWEASGAPRLVAAYERVFSGAPQA
jgi:glycosyltransferase involved in cell wall biosynthesis